VAPPEHEAVNTGTGKLKGLTDQEPWPGLPAFREQDEAYFFGRKEETAALLDRVESCPVSVLYGQSGLGKTSMILAGLFPMLRKRGYLPVWLRLNHSEQAQPLRSQILGPLAEALDRHDIEGPRPEPNEGLWEYFHRGKIEFWGARNRLVTPVIVLDQFEEIFTLGQRTDALAHRSREWLRELEAVLEHRPPPDRREAMEASPEEAERFDLRRESSRFVLSLREDFLPQLESLRRQLPSLQSNRLRLERMTGAQALQVVLTGGKALLDEPVARKIVDFVSASQRRRPLRDLEARQIEPALLSVVCDGLNQKRLRKGQSTLTEDLIVTEREGILEDFYEDAFEGTEARVRDWVEDHLLTASGFRQPGSLDNALAAGISADAFEPLEDKRIIHRDDREDVVRLELTHDLLTDPATRSRDRRVQRLAAEAAAAAAREAAAVAAQKAAEKAALAEKAARDAEAEARKLALEAEEAAKRLKESESNRRKLRMLVAVSALALLFAILAYIFALKRGDEVDRQRRLAETNAVVAQEALAQLKEETQRRAEADQTSARLAAKNTEFQIRHQRDRIAEELAGMGRSPVSFANESPVLSRLAGLLRSQPNDTHLAAMLLSELSSRTWPVPLAAPQILPEIPQEIVLSPGDEWIAVRTTNQVLVADYPRFEKGLRPLGLEHPPVAMAFSRDGSRLAVSTVQDTIDVFETLERRRISRITGVSSGAPLRFSKDGRFVAGFAVESSDNAQDGAARRCVLWSAESGALVRRLDPAVKPMSLVMTEDGMRLAGLTADDRLVLWTATNSAPAWERLVRPSPLRFRFILNDRYLLAKWPSTNRLPADGSSATVRRVNPAEVWNVETGGRIAGPIDEPAGAGESWAESDDVSSAFSGGLSISGEWVGPLWDGGQSSEAIRVPNLVHPSDLTALWYSIRAGFGNQQAVAARSGHWFSLIRAGGELWTYDNRPGYWSPVVSSQPTTTAARAVVTETFQLSGDRSKLLAVGGSSIRLFEGAPWLRLLRSLPLPEVIREAHWVPGEEHVLALLSEGFPRLLSWDGRYGTSGDLPKPLLDASGVTQIRTTTSGHVALLVFGDGRLRAVTLPEGSPLGPELGPFKASGGSRFEELSESGARLALVEGNQVTILELSSGQVITAPMVFNEPVSRVSLSEDGALVLVTTSTGSVTLKDLSRSQSIELGANTIFSSLRLDGQKAFSVGSGAFETTWNVWDRSSGVSHFRLNDSGRGVGWFGENAPPTWLEDELLVTTSGRLISIRYRMGPNAEFGSRASVLPTDWVERNTMSRGSLAPGDSVAGTWSYGAVDEKVAAFEVPWIGERPPEWLPGLAEAVCGQRSIGMGGTNNASPGVPPGVFLHIRDQILSESGLSGQSPWHRWATWFFSDRARRSASPAVPDSDVSDAPRNAFQWNDRNPYLGRELRKLRERGTGEEMLYAIETAKGLGFRSSEIQQTLAAFWRHFESRSEELVALESAVSGGTNSVDLLVEWIESRAANGLTNEVIQAWERIRSLRPKPMRATWYPEPMVETNLVLSTGDISRITGALRAVGQVPLAREAIRALLITSERDASLSARSINLDAYFNAPIDDLFNIPPYGSKSAEEQVKALGLVNGLRFDARGMLLMRGEGGASGSGGRTEDGFSGIPIGSKAGRLHFLHGGQSSGPTYEARYVVATYTVHYRDGGSLVIPLSIGTELGDSWSSRGSFSSDGPSHVWPTGAGAEVYPLASAAKVFQYTWTNPKPETEIVSLDITLSKGGPRSGFRGSRFFLLAVTAEE